MRRCHKFDDFYAIASTFQECSLRHGDGGEASCPNRFANQWASWLFRASPLPQNDTSHSIIHAGYGFGNSERARRQSGIIVANDISCVPSHLWNKMVFYMIMNKLYYVVGLVLLLLFALTREDLENIFVRANILPHRRRTFLYKEEIFKITKRLYVY